MHQIIESGLEDYFEGRQDRSFDAHLEVCQPCRATVSEMVKLSGLLGQFRLESAAATPPLGFAAGVLRRLQEDRRPGFWEVVSLNPAFTRKVALASLLGLAALGGYLITGSSAEAEEVAHTPEAVMASHDVSSPDVRLHQNGMLMTLATYRQ